MRADELDYVTRLSSSTLKSLAKELPEDNQPELWDRQSLVEFENDGKRYVVAGSDYRRQRDLERREARLAKGRDGLEAFNAVHRKNVDTQKLSAQVGRMLARAKAFKYFEYRIEEDGTATWSERNDIIQEESRFDGWYLLTTSLSKEKTAKETVFSHYQNLLAVEDAFRETKSYLEVRPIYHQKDDRVRNHIRICFLAFWISTRLRSEWQAMGEHREVPLVLRELQHIKAGKLKVKNEALKTVLTNIPIPLYELLGKLDLLNLFKRPPKWVQ
jgi:transposase